MAFRNGKGHMHFVNYKVHLYSKKMVRGEKRTFVRRKIVEREIFAGNVHFLAVTILLCTFRFQFPAQKCLMCWITSWAVPTRCIGLQRAILERKEWGVGFGVHSFSKRICVWGEIYGERICKRQKAALIYLVALATMNSSSHLCGRRQYEGGSGGGKHDELGTIYIP